MLNRREFLQVAAAAEAPLAVSSSAAFSAEPAGGGDGDGRSEARMLSEHRVAKIESRTMQHRFPRSLSPNGKGNPVGGGGSYQNPLQEFSP